MGGGIGWWVAGILLAVEALASSNARAAGFCIFSDAELFRANTSCSANETYLGTAAVDCVNGFEIEAKRVTATLQKALIGGVANQAIGSANAQRDFYASAQKNYDLTKNQLADLIRQGKAARARVNGFLDELVFPEDADVHQSWDFLASSPCYIDNFNLLNNVLTDFDETLLDLESAYRVAFGKEATSNVAKGKIKNGPAEQKLTSGTAAGAPKRRPAAAGNKKSKNSSSTITGKIKKDRLNSR